MTRRRALTLTSLDLSVVAAFIAVFKPYFIPDRAEIVLKIGLLFCVFLFLVTHLKLRKFVNASLILIVPIFCSGLYNYFQNGMGREFLNGILYALCLYCLFTLLLYWTQKGRFTVVMRDIYYILWIYCIISIVSILVLGKTDTYFFGSKFLTSYYFIFLLGLFYLQNKKRIEKNIANRIGYIILILIFAGFAWYMGCMTGFVGLLFFILFFIIPEPAKQVMANPIFVLIAVAVSFLLMFALSSMVQINVVQNIIVNIFQRAPNLSDRLRYYSRALNVFTSSNIWLGYGYDSSALRTAIGLGSNIQNGFMQYILNYGILGGVTCLITIYRSTNRKSAHLNERWGLYMVIFAMLVCAIVEVSFNTIFFFSLFLLYWSIQNAALFPNESS